MVAAWAIGALTRVKQARSADIPSDGIYRLGRCIHARETSIGLRGEGRLPVRRAQSSRSSRAASRCARPTCRSLPHAESPVQAERGGALSSAFDRPSTLERRAAISPPRTNWNSTPRARRLSRRRAADGERLRLSVGERRDGRLAGGDAAARRGGEPGNAIAGTAAAARSDRPGRPALRAVLWSCPPFPHIGGAPSGGAAARIEANGGCVAGSTISLARRSDRQGSRRPAAASLFFRRSR